MKNVFTIKLVIMKALFSLCICSMFLYVTSCSKGNDNNKSFRLVNIEKGGCFSKLKSAEKSYTNDTVFFKENADTLKMNVGIINNCCSKLAESVSIENNVVTVYVKDTCTQGCDCFCLCNFTYDFTFIHYTPKTLIYKVMLQRYKEKSYSIIMQDTLNK